VNVGDLVYRKSDPEALSKLGLVIDISDDVALVFWGHRNVAHKYHMFLLEVI
jgi:hypothetical protein